MINNLILGEARECASLFEMQTLKIHFCHLTMHVHFDTILINIKNYKEASILAGDTYIKINIWIDSNTGGVTLTASDYCDFVVEGYSEDNWSEKHYFDGKHDNTTYCQVYGGCYVTYQQITVVHVKVTVSSYTGTGVYENTISLV